MKTNYILPRIVQSVRFDAEDDLLSASNVSGLSLGASMDGQETVVVNDYSSNYWEED